MKILKRRIVSSAPLSEQMKSEIRAAHTVMEIPNRLLIETKFAVVPNVLDGVKLESDKDIDEDWLYTKIFDPRYHLCHLQLTEDEWKKAGINQSLYGSSSLVKGRVITFGRWHEKSKYKAAKKYEEPVRSLSEAAIGMWHEADHGFRRYFGWDSAITHYHFYGYDKPYSREQEKAVKPKRWVRTPDPILGWRSLPWENLIDIEAIPTQPHVPAPVDPGEVQPILLEKMNAFQKIMEAIGMPVRITSAYRSFAQQDALYAQGRTKPGQIVTNAKGGESFHNYGVAFDFVFVEDLYKSRIADLDGRKIEIWEAAGEIGKALGLSWGGDWAAFQDRPHFEYTGGYSLTDFQSGRVDYKKLNKIT